MLREEFARLIGVSRRTLENCEQQPARALLKIVAASPRAALESLHE